MKVDSKTLIVASLTMAAIACGPAPVPGGNVGGAPATTVTIGSGTTTSSGPVIMPSNQAKQFFAQNVYPALLTECGQCHAEGQFSAPIYLAGGADASYEFMHVYNSGALVATPDKNLLLLKDRHEGPDISSPARAKVTQWLAIEYPNIPVPPPPKNVFQALVNFGQCLSKNGFLDSGLDDLFNTPTDGGACTCATCHNQNDAAIFGGNLVLDQDPNLTFAGLQKFPGMMIFAQGAVADTGAFQGLIPSKRIELKGREPNINGPNQTACICDPNNRLDPVVDFGIYCHPTYALADDVIDRIDAFADTAIIRETTLQCNADNTK